MLSNLASYGLLSIGPSRLAANFVPNQPKHLSKIIRIKKHWSRGDSVQRGRKDGNSIMFLLS